MKLIVGLGNPGEKYDQTRHNLGFMCIEQFLKDFEPVAKTIWEKNEKLKSDIAILDWESKTKHGQTERVIVAKPKTYMNNSGLAVSLIANFYKVDPENIWIVYDEMDLPLGSMKIRFGGAGAGHHGIESIMQHLGTDKFWRFRLGMGMAKSGSKTQIANIKHDKKDDSDFVLKRFTGGQWGKARELIKRGSESLQMALEENLEAAMNRYNTK